MKLILLIILVILFLFLFGGWLWDILLMLFTVLAGFLGAGIRALVPGRRRGKHGPGRQDH